MDHSHLCPTEPARRAIQEVDHVPQSSSVTRLADGRPHIGRRGLSRRREDPRGSCTARAETNPAGQWRCRLEGGARFVLAGGRLDSPGEFPVSVAPEAIEYFRRKLDADPVWI